jgi:hypothetical protein
VLNLCTSISLHKRAVRSTIVQKPNSRTDSFFEVSGHNLKSRLEICLKFLNHSEGGVVFYQVFLLSPLQCTVMHYRNCKRLLEFEETKISRQSCRVGCSDFDFFSHFEV